MNVVYFDSSRVEELTMNPFTIFLSPLKHKLVQVVSVRPERTTVPTKQLKRSVQNRRFRFNPASRIPPGG